MARTGTWCAWMGGGGGREGKSLRLIVLESSVKVQHGGHGEGDGQGGRHTDGYHAFSVVVQVFQQHFAEGENLASASGPPCFVLTIIVPHTHQILLTADETTLFFEPPQQPADLPHHLAVCEPIGQPLLHNHDPVEDELIPAVSSLADADRVPNDTIVVYAKGEQAVAELLSGY